ncbi:hypothetical protein [Clostridium sp. Marseille-P2415]|uniref:hypothetical protein n=1 Tax=Clostridium sp. Marseille-P2415 TaxID=1805471 RepID=UPI001F2BC7B2|nr:hypothetical protein [Clostridium sp. Marseille-P2415]
MAYEGKMKYFILTNGDKNPFPQIINWSQTIDVRMLTRDEYQKMPPSIQLNAKLGMDGIFPDVIDKPFLLFSRTAMEVTALYDSAIPFLFFALFDTGKGECASYFCPVLEEEECLAGKPGPGQREIILTRRKMNGLPLFRVRIGMESAAIIRMDLAESLLEREIVGMELKEVRLTDSMDCPV